MPDFATAIQVIRLDAYNKVENLNHKSGIIPDAMLFFVSLLQTT